MRVPILLYHSIADEASSGFRKWTVPPGRFSDQMRHLSDEGYTTLTAADYAARLHTDAAMPEQPVVVTFDDGYADFTSAALPVMETYGVTSTLFVTAGYVGGTSAWLVRERETDRPMLSWDQLAELPNRNVELGGHGYSHRPMDVLPDEAAVRDIARGKEAIERETGCTIESFAYPHGYSTSGLRRAVAQMGFTSAHAVIDAMSSTDDRLYALSRLIVHAGMSLGRFRDVVAGIGVPSHPDRDSWQQGVWRSWRRARLAVRLDRPHVPQ